VLYLGSTLERYSRQTSERHIMNHAARGSRSTASAPQVRYLFIAVMFAVLRAFSQSPVPQGAVVEKIAGGFVFVEGPVWSDSLGLLFSDLSGNKVYRWTQATGAVAYITPSSNSNGLCYDLRSRLLLAQTGLRRVARRDSSGTIVSLAALFGGKRLNSPNDIAVKSDGAVFFTDPPFNVPAGQQRELTFSGIFRISPSGALQLLDSTLNEPNGICFSPDERKLYVDNSSQRIVYVWDVVNDSMIVNKRVFATIPPTGYADGMKVDSAGNLFCAAPLGIWVFGPDGSVLDTVLVPGQTTNCNWGDADRKTLYITSGNSVYRIRLVTTGVEEHSSVPGDRYILDQNFPNPFNPRTTIGFTVGGANSRSGVWGPGAGRVRLAVYDILGREVAVLVDDERKPGMYSERWDASERSSGWYLCRLSAGGSEQTRVMVLTR
jgi:gluconolactonase